MNDKKIFFRLGNNCYKNLYQIRLCGEVIPKNCIIYWHEYDNTLYIARKIPDYGGDVKNLILHVMWYDIDMRTIGTTYLKGGSIVRRLYNAWKNADKVHADRVQTPTNYEEMMRHSRRKKSGSGGRMGSVSELRYKQVTEEAYWANLFNAKSGNASVIANGIR